jgi:hypothetical protein
VSYVRQKNLALQAMNCNWILQKKKKSEDMDRETRTASLVHVGVGVIFTDRVGLYVQKMSYLGEWETYQIFDFHSRVCWVCRVCRVQCVIRGSHFPIVYRLSCARFFLYFFVVV